MIMIIQRSSRKWNLFFALTTLLLVSLACGSSSNGVVPTADPGYLQTAIVGTAGAAQSQTLTAKDVEQTGTPLPIIITAPIETSIPTLEPTALSTVVNGAVIQIKVVNKDDEYVDLENIGNQPQDITGWSLISEKGNQSCGLSGVIMPNTTLRVWANNPNGEGYNCNFDAEIWNNSELDPAILYNNQGQEVARYP
ncbi:MAG: lamin tail domain-containing protein [Chloroflexota bacterium]